MINNKLISIITASSNDLENLKRTYESLLASEYIDFEWNIIDNASEDNTFLWASQLNPDFKINCLSEKDSGIYDAWNKGLHNCKGDWIIFLGAGDLLHPGWLSEASEMLQSNYDIIYGDIEVLTSDGAKKLGEFNGQAWDSMMSALRICMCLPQSGCLHKAELFSNNKFDINFRIAGDWKFYLELKSVKGLYVERKVMCYFPIGGISSSLKGVRLAFREYKCLIKLGLAEFSFREMVKWRVKLLLSRNLKFYLFFQKKMWKIFT
jgi:glycosyltransferase involved in cell wall biosynthesis